MTIEELEKLADQTVEMIYRITSDKSFTDQEFSYFMNAILYKILYKDTKGRI